MNLQLFSEARLFLLSKGKFVFTLSFEDKLKLLEVEIYGLCSFKGENGSVLNAIELGLSKRLYTLFLLDVLLLNLQFSLFIVALLSRVDDSDRPLTFKLSAVCKRDGSRSCQ